MQKLKKAHENRQERLHVLQNNYKTLKGQLKQAEESQNLYEQHHLTPKTPNP
uniref:Uncharacterized protein n=1 Tax=Anguilla anguilla TaxID=7936 RepID=A0A0E9SZG4_ANGAN